MRSNLKLKHLQLVVALDEFRHLGRASEFLSLTQPAVSKSLAEIEKMFGLELFTRSTRGTRPTAYGEQVVRFARSVLVDFDRTCDDIAAVASGGAGRIRVGAMVVATPGLLVEAVGRLKVSSPQTTVAIEEGDLTRLLPRLRTGELDFIVGRLEPGYSSPDLETEALYAEPMRVVVAADHPLTSVAQPTWHDLAALPWVVPPAWASSRVKLNQMFYKHKLQPPTDIVETSSFLVTMTFMRKRGCVCFVASEVAHYLQCVGIGYTLPLAVPIELPPVGIILLRNGLKTPVAQTLIDALHAQARDIKGEMTPE
ncbi:LysR family transcriptional regulator [Pseudomonas fuscovaginae UPB0736]|uniref:LysR substrate-binding domain-containing protein n=1 Tax=Pseudomonas asplenii TaxID=53407 RepID=UPI000288DC47|nr:LysR substrate-binding domain-containing protein [Pseudomonas fuscovaginae]UUQ65637.1 LysR family transcriptional regulator [Pseudomonas fuscovaginae UPB0736]